MIVFSWLECHSHVIPGMPSALPWVVLRAGCWQRNSADDSKSTFECHSCFQASFSALQSHLIHFTERLHATEVEKRDLRHNEVGLRKTIEEMSELKGE